MSVVTLALGGPPAPAQELQSSDVIGNWQLSATSIDYLKSKGDSINSVELIFQADGTYREVNMPFFNETFNAPPMNNSNILTGT
jgi:hypothetical protein